MFASGYLLQCPYYWRNEKGKSKSTRRKNREKRLAEIKLKKEILEWKKTSPSAICELDANFSKPEM